MGTRRDKKKKKKPNQPGHGAAKTAAKQSKAEAKAQRRVASGLGTDEDDLDALLAAVALQDATANAVTLEELGIHPTTGAPAQPSPRVSATLCACIHGVPGTREARPELVLHGGEWHDPERDRTTVYGQTFVFCCARRRWQRLQTPDPPPPRSGHAAAVVRWPPAGAHPGFLYVWGGEFVSPNDARFRHWRDLWRLDLETRRWAGPLPGGSKGGPSARSGARMAAWGRRLVLFGGFTDDGSREARYHQDLWCLDTGGGPGAKWIALGHDGGEGRGPSPRSAVGLIVVPAGGGEPARLFIHMGYTREPDSTDAEVERGKRVSGRA